jgi:hypothetical protein
MCCSGLGLSVSLVPGSGTVVFMLLSIAMAIRMWCSGLSLIGPSFRIAVLRPALVAFCLVLCYVVLFVV